MFSNMTGWHLLIVLAVILLLFGATRLPALAKSMGQSARLFKREIKAEDPIADASHTATSPDAPATRSASSESAPAAIRIGE
jgi:sec-independent protein translocase protein TatA